MTTIDKRTSFLQVPNVFFETCALPDSAQMLFLRLAAHLGKQQQTRFTGSIRQLANAIRMSKSTVDRMLKLLESVKLATITHELGTETSRAVMRITLAMDALWELNTYHNTVAPVPNWDKELPDCPNLGRNVPDRDEMSQFDVVVSHQRDVLSQPQAQIRDNTFNTKKTDSIHKKEETPTASLSPIIFTLEEQRRLDWFCGLEEAPKDLERAKRHCAALIADIQTLEQFQRLHTIASQQIYGADKRVKLGNMVNALSIWRKEQQQREDQWWDQSKMREQAEDETAFRVIEGRGVHCPPPVEEEKPFIPPYLMKAICQSLSQCVATSGEQVYEQDIAYAVEVWQNYGIPSLIFKHLLEETLANSQCRGIEYMLNTLARKAEKMAQQSIKQEA